MRSASRDAQAAVVAVRPPVRLAGLGDLSTLSDRLVAVSNSCGRILAATSRSVGEAPRPKATAPARQQGRVHDMICSRHPPCPRASVQDRRLRQCRRICRPAELLLARPSAKGQTDDVAEQLFPLQPDLGGQTTVDDAARDCWPADEQFVVYTAFPQPRFQRKSQPDGVLLCSSQTVELLPAVKQRADGACRILPTRYREAW